jgi:hypothetical protein
VSAPSHPSPPASSRAELLAAAGIVALVVGAVVVARVRHALAPHATAAQCAALLDRYVEHLAHAAEPAPAASTIAAERAEARARAATDARFARCPDELTAAQASCAMDAHDADELERCIE